MKRILLTVVFYTWQVALYAHRKGPHGGKWHDHCGKPCHGGHCPAADLGSVGFKMALILAGFALVIYAIDRYDNYKNK